MSRTFSAFYLLLYIIYFYAVLRLLKIVFPDVASAMCRGETCCENEIESYKALNPDRSPA